MKTMMLWHDLAAFMICGHKRDGGGGKREKTDGESWVFPVRVQPWGNAGHHVFGYFPTANFDEMAVNQRGFHFYDKETSVGGARVSRMPRCELLYKQGGPDHLQYLSSRPANPRSGHSATPHMFKACKAPDSHDDRTFCVAVTCACERT